MATTVNDKVMYVLLVGAIMLGLWTTLVAVGAGHEAHNYRETVSPWFRSHLPPAARTSTRWRRRRSSSTSTSWSAMLLFAAWPFTRLVHAFTAPVHYLFRPYIVYRSRDCPHAGADRSSPRRLEPGRHARP